MSTQMASMGVARTLHGIVRVRMKMEVVTGLLIRMPLHAQVYRIGGADLYPIVTRKKYVLGNTVQSIEVPLIPGSSLKGRMRSLLELSLGKPLYSTDYRIWLHARVLVERRPTMTLKELDDDIVKRCEIDEVFGAPALGVDQLVDYHAEQIARSRGRDKPDMKDVEEAWNFVRDNLLPHLMYTRLLVDDAFPSEDYLMEVSENGRRIVSIADFLEEKGENRIDRVTSAADPRQVARVKPGVVFDVTMRLLIFDIDKGYVRRNLNLIAKGLKLIEETYLGASGSRGYGRVKFRNIVVEVLNAKERELKYTAYKEPSGQVREFRSLEEFLESIDRVSEWVEKILFGQ